MEDGTLSILFSAVYPAVKTVHSQDRCLNKYHGEWMNLWDVVGFTQSIHLAANQCQHLHGITVENEWINNFKVFNIRLGGLLWTFLSDILCFLVTLYIF